MSSRKPQSWFFTLKLWSASFTTFFVVSMLSTVSEKYVSRDHPSGSDGASATSRYTESCSCSASLFPAGKRRMRQLYSPLWKTGLYSFVCFSLLNPSITHVNWPHSAPSS